MEGKDGEDDPRASPLDFLSASHDGAVFQHYQQQQRHWTRPLTTGNAEAYSTRQRLEHTISPPTIPRETNIFTEGQRNISHNSNSLAGNSGRGESSMMPTRDLPSSPVYMSFDRATTNTQEFSTITSAFTRRAQDFQFHGQIPAYGTLGVHHQHRNSSSSSGATTGDITATYESSSAGSTPTAITSDFSNIIIQQQQLRPISSASILDESISSTADLETITRGRAFLQPKARRTRDRSRTSSSGRGRSSSRKSRAGKSSVSSPENTIATASSPPSRDEASKSPPPQNLRGDPFRSAKVKTELCRNYYAPRGCPFGDKCNYAHGEHELKFTKLVDLERAGLIDIEIFRTHPCPTWVATGSCPFDQRCIGLHDPRVEGSPSYHAWLPHAETMINKVANGVNVDNFYHERVAHVYNHCPIYGFVPIVDENAEDFKSEASFKNFYEFICNVDRLRQHERSISNERPIDEETTLEIVLKLRQGNVGASYSYMPTHMLNSELCMVLQAKTFQSRKADRTLTVIEHVEESSTSYDQDSITIQVHEIAFGPVGDPTVRPVSIWLDIKEGELVECTPQQAKHHKRSRHRLKKKAKSGRSSSRTINEEMSRNTEPFDHYQPRDRDAFNLITDILRLRLKTIKALETNPGRQAIQYLEDDMNALKISYFRQLKYWVTWSWPEQVLHDVIEYDTDVPPVDSEYDCYVHDVIIGRGEKGCDCHALGTKRYTYNLTGVEKCLPSFIWKSFIINMQVMVGKPMSEIRRTSSTADDKEFFNLKRLPIFQQLSMGSLMSRTRVLPHISNAVSQSNKDVETLFNQWDGTRIHYKAKIVRASQKISERDEVVHKEVSQLLDALAKIIKRAL